MNAARSLTCLSLAALLVRFAAGCNSTGGAAALPDDGGPDATEDSGEPGDTSTPEDQTTGDAGSDQATGPEASGGDGAGPEGSTANDSQAPESGTTDSATGDSAATEASTDAAITEGGADAGGPTPQVLLLGVTSAGAVTGDVFDGTTWGAAMAVTGTATSDDLSLAMIPATGYGLGLLHGTSSALVYTAWNGATWSSLAQLNSDTTQGQPTVVASGSSAFAVFWGTDYKYYLESYAAGAWSSAPQGVFPPGVAAQPCGPSPGVLAPLGASASLLFVNGSCSGTVNHLYDSDLVSGAWQASQDLAINPSYSPTQRPALVAPTSGPELVAVFIQQGTSQLLSATRTGGTWSTPAAITGALTSVPVALAPLAGGGVQLAFEGTDTNLYTATFSGGSWSSPAAPFSSSVSIAATPALATGIGTAAAEMVYVSATGALFHTRLTGSTWSMPTAVASGTTTFAHVAIASGP